MAHDWELRTVAELQAAGALLVEDGNHGENRPRPDEFSAEGIQFIRAADMDGGRVLFESAQRINEVARQRVRKGIGAGGDVLLSHKGTVGKVAFVPLNAPPFVCSPQTTFWRAKDPKQLDRRFIYYFLSSRGFREQLDSRKGETDMADYVSLTTQRTLKVTVPPLLEQKAIAQVLGTLDDKIELNRRMNATLEAMARALFQNWFVDFDPVRAKLDGRKPARLDAATTALFPAHFDHAADGVVPKGWKRNRWGDIATLEYGKSLRDYRVSGGKYRVFGTNGPIGFHDVALCNSAGIVIGRKGAYRGIHYSPDPFFVIDTAFYLKPKAPLDLKWAYYELLRFNINGMDSGSAIPSTSRDDFYGIPVIAPPAEIQNAFGEMVGGWFAKSYANIEQSRTLATLRDTLLPKLLCGELRVSGAERIVGRATS